jgi:pimeloyl-ACP methyl ester carboxylesterase
MQMFVSHADQHTQRPVTFLSEDSVHLRGMYWEPREDRAISLLLLHDARADRTSWDPFVPLFRTRGWGVLAFDLRGHGESVRQDMRADLLTPHEADLTSPFNYPHDVKAAIAFMARQTKADPAKLAVIGAGLGADLAYAAAGRGWGSASTVCVGLDEARGRALAGTGAFAPRSIYLLYGAGDATSAGSVEAFTAAAGAPAETHPYPGTQKAGLALFAEQQPEILARSIAWIERTI